MITVDDCTMKIIHACTMIIVHACTMIIVRACTMIIVRACTIIILHACTVLIVHACTMIFFRRGASRHEREGGREGGRGGFGRRDVSHLFRKKKTLSIRELNVFLKIVRNAWRQETRLSYIHSDESSQHPSSPG